MLMLMIDQFELPISYRDTLGFHQNLSIHFFLTVIIRARLP
jgi:hypothetical protein